MGNNETDEAIIPTVPLYINASFDKLVLIFPRARHGNLNDYERLSTTL